MANPTRHLCILLVLSMLLLSVLVPGGPVETRDFSHISPVILGLFNAFLTILGMGSLFVAYGVYRQHDWSFGWAMACGVSYLFVYLLDLASIFPVSPTAMPLSLLAIECAGSVVALPVVVLSYQQLINTSTLMTHANPINDITPYKPVAVFVIASVIGAAIIIFATLSAMGR